MEVCTFSVVTLFILLILYILIPFSLCLCYLTELSFLVWQKKGAKGEAWLYAEAKEKDQTNNSDKIGGSEISLFL